MPESNIQSLLARLPDPGDGKMPPVDQSLAAELVESLVNSGPAAIAELAGLLKEIDDGSDWKARFALHALVIHAGGKDRDQPRKLLIDSIHGELAKDHPALVKTFLVSELRYIAGPDSIPALLPLLASDAIPLADAAAAVMASIGPAAKAPLTDALGKAGGRQKDLISHALLQLAAG